MTRFSIISGVALALFSSLVIQLPAQPPPRTLTYGGFSTALPFVSVWLVKSTMWHHTPVIRFVSTPFRTCIYGFLLLSPALPAQSHRHSAADRGAIVSTDPLGREIADLVVAQQRALASGDSATIAQATRPLTAQLLRDVAKLRVIQGKGQEALELYRKSLQLQDAPEARLELTSTLIRNGKPQEAANEALVAVQADPHSASAWTTRGVALRADGQYADAVDAFKHSLEIHSDPNTAYALGSVLLAMHEKEQAKRIFQEIIRASGNAAIWHVAVGDAYREALSFPEAVEQFKETIAIDPRIGHVEFFLGLTYLQMNRWGPDAKSLEHLRRAVQLAPRDYLSNFYLGAAESTAGGDLAASDRHLHVAAEADSSSSPEAWLYLGLNAVREKQMVAAKMYLRKAIDLPGTDESRNTYQVRRAYFALGRILIAEGDRAEGEALLAKYKRSEQEALNTNAGAIASAASDESTPNLGAIAALPPSFPGMRSVNPSEALDTAQGHFPNKASRGSELTPTQTAQLATERRLGELLASSFNDLGTAEARQGNYTLALVHFQEAQKWGAPTPTLLRNLGAAAFRLGDYNESARALRLYLNAEQSAPSAGKEDRYRMMLAMSLFSSGQFAKAEKEFGVMPDTTLKDPRAAYSWAYSLAHSGQQQHANQIADTLWKQDLPVDVLSLVCHLYMDTESYEQSIACFRKAYAADPTLKLAHYQVAESLIRLDRPAEAIPELKQELALTPDNPDVQYSLAFALLQTSHKDEAMKMLESITSSDPSHAQAQYQLGKALLEQGSIPDAVRHLELAEQNDPAPDYIHYQLQAAYRKAGRIEDADRELRIYKETKARSREVTPNHP